MVDSPSVKDFSKRLPPATIIIGTFWLLVLILGMLNGFELSVLLSDTVERFGMWALLALAMVPSIQSGIGPNFALPVGICGGLLAISIAIELGFTGFVLLFVGMAFAIVIGGIMGYSYGLLMNAVKGSEMIIAIFIGFAVTYLFCIVWLIFPYRYEHIPLLGFGWTGVRNFINLEPYEASRIMSQLWEFKLLGVIIPTGTLLFIAVCCLMMWLFFRSKQGIAISAAGMNPMFARASGINVNRSRILAGMISTALAAVGAIVYYQCFGFIQLYDAPLMMAFPAVAAILVGGASMRSSKVIHVIIGTLLFQGVMANSPPVLSGMIAGTDMTDSIRMVIQNGIILYALIQMNKGVSRKIAGRVQAARLSPYPLL